MAGSRIPMCADLVEHLRARVPDLPRFCTRVVLTLEIDELPKVDVTFHPEVNATRLDSSASEFKPGGPVTRRYRLVPDDGPHAGVNVAAGVSRAEVLAAVEAANSELMRRLRQCGLIA